MAGIEQDKTVADVSAKRIGGFRVLDNHPLGTGREGLVWRAVCENPPFDGVKAGEVVAVKTMSENDPDGTIYRKLQLRTDALVKLNHPNIVRYRGCFRLTDSLNEFQAVVMDWLDGESLHDKLRRHPGGLDADEALEICEKVATGLAAAERAGIVHRDIKPSNIFICRDGSVKVIDFELAHAQGGTVSDASGKFFGTFNYMSPEFIDPKFRGDERSDVFSFGVVLHETLTGRLPYSSRGRANQPDFDYLERWSDPQTRAKAVSISDRATRLLSGIDAILKGALAPEAAERTRDFAMLTSLLAGVRYREFQRGETRYRLVRLVGTGGFGDVFKARRLPDGAIVAIKHLHDQRNGDRFRKEAGLMQRLKDDYFTQFIDYFETVEHGKNHAYIVMQFLPGMPGSSLRDAIHAASRQGKVLSPDEVKSAFERYLRGLKVMHSQEIYHRDIKPSNLYYPPGHPERSVIMDMGIARNAAGSVSQGQVPGTLDYMPPEVVNDPECRGDARMDLYALGLCLYEALTGRQGFRRLPSGDDGLRQFYNRCRREEAPVFDDPEILHRPSFHRLLCDMTNPRVDRRIASAEEAGRRLAGLDWKRDRVETPIKVARRKAKAPKMEVVRDEADTSDTGSTLRPSSRGMALPVLSDSAKRWCLRVVAVAALVIALVPVVALARKPVCEAWDKLIGRIVRDDAKKILCETNAASAEKAVGAVESAYSKSLADGDASAEKWENDWSALEYPEGGSTLAECRVRIGKARLGCLVALCAQEAKPIIEAYATALSVDQIDTKADEWLRRWTEKFGSENLAALQSEKGEIDSARRECVLRAEARRNSASYEADAVVGYYRKADSVGDGDAAAVAWIAKWETNSLPSAVVSSVTNDFAIARAECEERIRNREKEGKIRAERQTRVRTILVAAKKVADEIIADFQDDTKLSSSIVARYAKWRTDLEKALEFCHSTFEREPECRQIAERIDAAKRERDLRRGESKVVYECEALFRNIWIVTAENVRNWRHECLEKAEKNLLAADRDGRISAASKERLEREIELRGKWCVGVVRNRMHEPAVMLGETIEPISERTLVFTNAIPEGTVITVDGFEPRPIDFAHFDGKVIEVRPDNAVEKSGDAWIDLPQLPEGTVCLLDGVIYSGGRVKVRSGEHELVFRRLRETTPGTRDFNDIQQKVRVSKGQVASVISPKRWTENPNSKTARQNALLSALGDQIYATCVKEMQILPLSDRRERLAKVHATLGTMKAQEALGNARYAELTSRFDEESARAIGYVLNEMNVPVRIKVYDRWIELKPGEKSLVSFDSGFRDGMPKDAYVMVDGYECAFLPDRNAFDGGEFTVAEDILKPKPVSVRLPTLGESVTCRIDGKLVSGGIELTPGDYKLVYSKSGMSDQSFIFKILPGVSPVLPTPNPWKASGFLEGVGSAVRNLTSSIGNGIKSVGESLENSRIENSSNAPTLERR